LSIVGSHVGAENNNKQEDPAFDKSLQMAILGAKGKALSATVTDKACNEAEGTRTLNLRIDRPLLGL
jgi:hypothetical protein